MESIKSHGADDETSRSVRDEAIALARRSAAAAPSKPFGYAALSVSSKLAVERFEYLKQAIALSTDRFRFARIGLLVRLLLEPRIEESRAVKGKIGKASLKHPNRRHLTQEEQEIYRRICNDLEVVQNSYEDLEAAQKDLLSNQQFRLGQFFRKKEPSVQYKPIACRHFQKCRMYRASSQYEMAGFWLATLLDGSNDEKRSEPVLRKCPEEYIVGLYSSFATNFDNLLVGKLEYQTPTKLRRLLDDVLGVDSKTRFCCCYDLGCGTGLSGIAFRDLVDELIGVDLSPDMLDEARRRDCYDMLRLGDVEEALAGLTDNESQSTSMSIDLVVACDVFCYIGDLAPTFRSVSETLAQGGYFCFSTELLEHVDVDSPPFLLRPTGRFCHQKEYVKYISELSSLNCMELQTTNIRKNQGRDVMGLIVVLRKV